MNIKLLIVVGLTLLVSNITFGQKKYLNSEYQLDGKEVSLIVTPIYNERKSLNDSTISKMFEDTSGNVILREPSSSRQLIDSSEKLTELINKIVLKEYKKKELKACPNLKTLLTQSEIDFLKNGLENPDLILIPIAFNIKVVGGETIGGHTFGYSNFRLYDLSSGEFIFECPNNLNVNIGGEKGARSLTAVLISMTSRYYKENFLKR